MFDFVRNHTRWVMAFLLLLIIPSFVFFGVQGYSRFGDDGARAAATIDGRNISRDEVRVAIQREVERVRSQTPNIDPALLDRPWITWYVSGYCKPRRATSTCFRTTNV
jgi:peptidyl-prolyl cis-trans isomerase D